MSVQTSYIGVMGDYLKKAVDRLKSEEQSAQPTIKVEDVAKTIDPPNEEEKENVVVL